MVASNDFFSTSWIWFLRHAELELRIISYCIVFLGIISSIHFIYTPPFINVCERVGLWFQTCFNVPPRIMLETANETCPNSQRSGDNCDFDPTIFWCLWQLGKLGCGQIHGLIGAICISNGQLVESCLKLQWRKWQSTGGLPRTWWELSAASFLYGDCWPAGMSRQETCCGPWVWPGNRGSLKKASSSSAPPQDQFLAFQPWSSSFKRHPTLYPCLLSVRNHFSPVSLGIPIAWFIRVGVVSLLIQKYSDERYVRPKANLKGHMKPIFNHKTKQVALILCFEPAIMRMVGLGCQYFEPHSMWCNEEYHWSGSWSKWWRAVSLCRRQKGTRDRAASLWLVIWQR